MRTSTLWYIGTVVCMVGTFIVDPEKESTYMVLMMVACGVAQILEKLENIPVAEIKIGYSHPDPEEEQIDGQAD